MGKGGDSSVATTNRSASAAALKKIAWTEVQKHRTPEDAWVVHNNKVYDVSNWFEHPGGAVIFTHAGDDMTDIFAAFHAPGSQNLMKKFYIGDVDTATLPKDEKQLAFEQGYRELRAQMVKMGLFQADKTFYAFKCASNLLLLAIPCFLVYFSHSTWVHMASAVILGLFWQQCGWLAHEFLHHQVFRKRKYGDLAGIFWGNFLQGFSVQWWKNKHNGHHAVPNLHSATARSQDGDPDIDTMPLLAWSLKQAQSYRELAPDGKDLPFVRFMISYQALFYFPILLLARLSWLNESFKVTYGLGAATENAALEMKVKGLQYPWLEKIGTALHFAWVFCLSSGFGTWGIGKSISFFLLATCSCGFFLAIVFGLGHNGMATYNADARPDFWKLQVTTTRNVVGGHGFSQAFVDWFCGGLQYQVDHHLFPTLPRHNLKKANELVSSFCKKWGVKYHEADLVDGTMEVLYHLNNVSNQFVLDFVRDGPTM